MLSGEIEASIVTISIISKLNATQGNQSHHVVQKLGFKKGASGTGKILSRKVKLSNLSLLQFFLIGMEKAFCATFIGACA